MENPWRAPVVAVEDGLIKYWESSLGGCMLYLYGRSGATYMYIHLNNDLTARNDNKGGCANDVSFSVPNGAKVTAGQQIAWNGDSGDANGNPHLHFEVHPNDGADVDPFRYLKRAMKPSSLRGRAASSASRCTGSSSLRARGPQSCRSTGFAGTPEVAGSTSTRVRWSSPCRSVPTSRPSTNSTEPRCARLRSWRPSPCSRSRRTQREAPSWVRRANSCSAAYAHRRHGRTSAERLEPNSSCDITTEVGRRLLFSYVRHTYEPTTPSPMRIADVMNRIESISGV